MRNSGYYCSDYGTKVVCDKLSAGPTERFKLEKQADGTYAIKASSSNKYCSDEKSGLMCNRDKVGPWEKFRFTMWGPNSISITGGNGSGAKYCTDYDQGITCSAAKKQGWEQFVIEKVRAMI